jgi:hypothetical protein
LTVLKLETASGKNRCRWKTYDAFADQNNVTAVVMDLTVNDHVKKRLLNAQNYLMPCVVSLMMLDI